LLWRIIWGPRLRGSRRDGLLYGLLNCHATRPTRSGLLPYLATIIEPHEESDEKSDEESDERSQSSSHDIPPAPPKVSPSSPHGAIPSSIVVNESRVVTAVAQ
jgi:hypothetical protein